MAATTSQTIQSYCNLIVKSKLLPAADVKDAFRHWQETNRGGSDSDAEPFRKHLVTRKLLTEYQSHLLLRGHTDGYFIDQYRILDLISKGPLSGVYKAVHVSGQMVSIKVLPPSKAKDPTVLSRFQREGRLLTRLDHTHVVRAFQIGEANGKHYIVMEHMEGEPLDETLARRKKLPPPEAARLIHQALLGLQHIFEKGMVHRDLKPATLFLTPAPTGGATETTLYSLIKIMDIGMGRATFDESSQMPDPDTQLTSDGTILGSADYLAPEQARSAHDSDIRADIYSLGCVLYHLLTGQPPFPDENMLSQIVRHATEPPRPVRELAPMTPDGLQQVLNWMMAKDPNHRYPTPSQAAQALQGFLLQTPAVAAPTVAPAFQQYLQTSGWGDGSRQAPALGSTLVSPPPPMFAPPQPIFPQPAPMFEQLAPSIPVGRIEGDAGKKDRKKALPTQKMKPQAAPEPAPPTSDLDGGDFDVEIVAAPNAPLPSSPAPFFEPLDKNDKVPERKEKEKATESDKDDDEQRSLLVLDKRDYIMAGTGGGIVLFAILIGLGVSALVKKPSPSPSTPTEQQQDDEKKPRIVKPPETIKKKEDPKMEDPKMKDMMKEEVKKEEMKKEEMKKEEPKEPKTNDNNQD